MNQSSVAALAHAIEDAPKLAEAPFTFTLTAEVLKTKGKQESLF